MSCAKLSPPAPTFVMSARACNLTPMNLSVVLGAHEACSRAHLQPLPTPLQTSRSLHWFLHTGSFSLGAPVGVRGDTPTLKAIYGALATSRKGKSRVDAEADFDRLFICIVGVECGVM
jgi:hypothetical protein